ncbi:integrase arm-type DNA-binding domain-containing protein [Aliiroseovarius subalbicans]|uniref:tyrosine-type recombinase/integrase n=1 Tax=Aliiroseovarius subalbicans TaxID=2925840 RepID=UPI001F585D62|nr:integrase arm-type DNA-binding domain-containing protein [Aliiroseovarius subalbicans]MCI2399135.1 integrase arm-type DNA-binding domain-containing protein [Aliiroseovarius subalbicans]
MPLTDVKIKNLKARDKPYKIADFAGLYIEVRPTGSRLWRLKYRFEGREKRLSFGAYPAVSLAEARTARDAAKSLLSKGVDPGKMKQQEKRAKRAVVEHSFEHLANAFLAKGAAEGRAKATQTKNEWLLSKAKSDFGHHAINEITAPMILDCLRKVEAKGNYETAQRLRAKISAVFRFAVASGIADADPAHALRDALIRPTPKPRAAILDAKSLGGLLRAIDGFEGQRTTRIALHLQSLLAQRPGELRHAEWTEFNFVEAIWSIPAERMKMRRPHLVPLSKQALAHLDELRRITGNGRFLFPSLRSFHRPMSENTLNAALRRLGYSSDEMTAHGFRASFSTLANESGLWNPDAIERALAHVEKNEVRRAYARGEHWEERVRLADWWAGFLDEVRSS